MEKSEDLKHSSNIKTEENNDQVLTIDRNFSVTSDEQATSRSRAADSSNAQIKKEETTVPEKSPPFPNERNGKQSKPGFIRSYPVRAKPVSKPSGIGSERKGKITFSSDGGSNAPGGEVVLENSSSGRPSTGSEEILKNSGSGSPFPGKEVRGKGPWRPDLSFFDEPLAASTGSNIAVPENFNDRVSKHCVVPGCMKPGQLFRVPLRPEWRAKWQKSLRLDFLGQRAFVCSRHFTRDSFYVWSGRVRVKKDAKPYRDLPAKGISSSGVDKGLMELHGAVQTSPGWKPEMGPGGKENSTSDSTSTADDGNEEDQKYLCKLPVPKEMLKGNSGAGHCVVPGCFKPGRLFRIPRARPEWLEEWRKSLGMGNVLTRYSTVCALHFPPDSFYMYGNVVHIKDHKRPRRDLPAKQESTSPEDPHQPDRAPEVGPDDQVLMSSPSQADRTLVPTVKNKIGKYCVVRGCFKPGQLFPVPYQKDRLEEWRKSLAMDFLGMRAFVCSLHFTPESFYFFGNELRIKRDKKPRWDLPAKEESSSGGYDHQEQNRVSNTVFEGIPANLTSDLPIDLASIPVISLSSNEALPAKFSSHLKIPIAVSSIPDTSSEEASSKQVRSSGEKRRTPYPKLVTELHENFGCDEDISENPKKGALDMEVSSDDETPRSSRNPRGIQNDDVILGGEGDEIDEFEFVTELDDWGSDEEAPKNPPKGAHDMEVASSDESSDDVEILPRNLPQQQIPCDNENSKNKHKCAVAGCEFKWGSWHMTPNYKERLEEWCKGMKVDRLTARARICSWHFPNSGDLVTPTFPWNRKQRNPSARPSRGAYKRGDPNNKTHIVPAYRNATPSVPGLSLQGYYFEGASKKGQFCCVPYCPNHTQEFKGSWFKTPSYMWSLRQWEIDLGIDDLVGSRDICSWHFPNDEDFDKDGDRLVLKPGARPVRKDKTRIEFPRKGFTHCCVNYCYNGRYSYKGAWYYPPKKTDQLRAWQDLLGGSMPTSPICSWHFEKADDFYLQKDCNQLVLREMALPLRQPMAISDYLRRRRPPGCRTDLLDVEEEPEVVILSQTLEEPQKKSVITEKTSCSVSRCKNHMETFDGTWRRVPSVNKTLLEWRDFLDDPTLQKGSLVCSSHFWTAAQKREAIFSATGKKT